MVRFLLACALLATPAALSAADIEVSVHGVRNAKGHVRVDICTEATFLKDCAWHGDAPAHAGTVRVLVRGVPPGRYGAQAFQDANDNGKVDQGLFGIPKEGVGFSNDAKIRLAPPKFADAAFTVGNGATSIGFTLRYF